jgi:hypothetical protein
MTFEDLGTPPPVGAAYPSWGSALIAMVDRALCAAWERVKKRHPALLQGADEDRITDQLKTELVAMRRRNEPAGFNANLFGVPTRDSKLRDAAGESIDKTPDLTVYPAQPRAGVADDQHDALFFECKVLDATRGLTLYCNEGIRRFVDGRYAWRMPHAGMIAYVLKIKDPCPVKSLTRHLARRVGTSTIGSQFGCAQAPTMAMQSPGTMASDIAETRHVRRAQDGTTLDEIALRHLWLLG